MAKRILIITHRLRANPGFVGRWLRIQGFSLDIRIPRLGEKLPISLQEYAGVIVFGGPMSANDTDEYIYSELDLIGKSLDEGIPFLGICLGAQLLTKKLGGAVYRHPKGLIEVGYHPIYPTREGRYLQFWPMYVYQWHQEGITLPSECVLLATGLIFEHQAFRYGDKAFGLQFHPEITLPMIGLWTTTSYKRLFQPGAKPRRHHIISHQRYSWRQRLWLNQFLSQWINQPG